MRSEATTIALIAGAAVLCWLLWQRRNNGQTGGQGDGGYQLTPGSAGGLYTAGENPLYRWNLNDNTAADDVLRITIRHAANDLNDEGG